MIKTCNKCGAEKDKSLFYTGRNQCKQCKRAYTASRVRSRIVERMPESATAQKSRISCLKCDKGFNSPDRIKIRICSPCKLTPEWRGSREVDSMIITSRRAMGPTFTDDIKRDRRPMKQLGRR